MILSKNFHLQLLISWKTLKILSDLLSLEGRPMTSLKICRFRLMVKCTRLEIWRRLSLEAISCWVSKCLMKVLKKRSLRRSRGVRWILRYPWRARILGSKWGLERKSISNSRWRRSRIWGMERKRRLGVPDRECKIRSKSCKRSYPRICSRSLKKILRKLLKMGRRMLKAWQRRSSLR